MFRILIFLVLSVLLDDPVGVAVYLLFALPGIVIGCAYGLYCALKGPTDKNDR